MRTFFKNRGVGLIEVVIGVSIFIIVVIAVLGVQRFVIRFSSTASNSLKGYYLLEESLEVARVIRDTDWNTFSGLTSGQPYYLSLSGNIWSATTSPVLVDGFFYRTIEINDVYRDGNDDISESGTIDPDTYFVTATVSWLERSGTTTKTTSMYLANLFE